MQFSTVEVNVKDLLLDPKNPRFIIPPNSDQKSIIEYLLEFEEIVELAKGINSFKGLLPGERVIVCKENGNLVVLEGNRRVCACKLLLDRLLVPSKYNKFPEINSETKTSIEKIYVDIVSDRESTQSTLYKRHIDGIKDWPPISKLKFYANEFANGMSIERIAEITSSTTGNVKQGIRDYHFILKAVYLDGWKSDEKPNIYEIKTSRLKRVLEVNSEKYNITGARLLKLNFDEKTLEPYSELENHVFEHALYLIAKAAFFYKKEFNTRSTIDDVPGLIEYLTVEGILPKQEETTYKTEGGSSHSAYNGTSSEGNSSGKEGNSSNSGANTKSDAHGGSSASNSTNQGNNNGNSNKQSGNNGTSQTPKTPLFFHALTWNRLNASNHSHFGLILLADEIKRLSLNNHYGNYYPVSTAILLRSLFEQTLKYYTKLIGEWDNLILFAKKKPGYDPMLGKIIEFYKSNNNYLRFFSERTIQSAFSIATNQSMLDFFDTIVHNTHIVKPTKIELENKAANGLFSLIQYILNDT